LKTAARQRDGGIEVWKDRGMETAGTANSSLKLKD